MAGSKVNVRKEASPKLSMALGIKGDPLSARVIHEANKNGGIHKAKDSKGKEYQMGVDAKVNVEAEKRDKPVYLRNKANFPQTVAYNGMSLVVAPREKVLIANKDKLGRIPKYMYVLPVKGDGRSLGSRKRK